MPCYFAIQAIIVLVLYFLLISLFFIGWLKTRTDKPDQPRVTTRVSILVPCRNEATNISELATILNNQDYPANLLEIIWIDDHSTDHTDVLVDHWIQKKTNNHLVVLNGEQSGKKSALKAGMALATGTLILLTDADSRPGKRWVSAMVGYFEQSDSDLILGPVILDPAPTAFQQMQKLEYLSLVAASIGAAGIGCPIMAQGPNIGVRATDYREIVLDLNNHFASGDDVFLLQSMKRLSGKKIRYLVSSDALVCSKPAESLSQFLRQRSRWASKATGYQDPCLIATTLLVFLANLEIIAAATIAFLDLIPFSLPLILLGIKTLADAPLLFKAMRRFHCTKLIRWLLPVQILYPVYILLAGLHSQWAPVIWKTK